MKSSLRNCCRMRGSSSVEHIRHFSRLSPPPSCNSNSFVHQQHQLSTTTALYSNSTPRTATAVYNNSTPATPTALYNNSTPATPTVHLQHQQLCKTTATAVYNNSTPATHTALYNNSNSFVQQQHTCNTNSFGLQHQQLFTSTASA